MSEEKEVKAKDLPVKTEPKPLTDIEIITNSIKVIMEHFKILTEVANRSRNPVLMRIVRKYNASDKKVLTFLLQIIGR